jgi:hypothetical protein
MTTFTAETFHNRFLAAGATAVDAIVTITAATPVGSARSTVGTGEAGWESPLAAEVLVIDTSSSMSSPLSKFDAARRATTEALDCIGDGVQFAVVAGNGGAEVVYPTNGVLATASDATRREAKAAVRGLRAKGGTAIGRWLLEANRLFTGTEPATIRHALLLTDGRDESESRADLERALEECRGRFQCDSRGVGADWEVEELRLVARQLLGSVDIIPHPEEMATAFRTVLEGAMARRTGDVVLRVDLAPGAVVELAKQVAPAIVDLQPRIGSAGQRSTEYPTGAWASETRDYHLRIRLPIHQTGAGLLAARVSLLVDGEVASRALVDVTWTEDLELSTRLCHEVAVFTGQVELADAIETGLDARSSGDLALAAASLGHAVQLAFQLGSDEQLARLGTVVEIDDAATGSVRLRQQVSDLDELTTRTRSSRTVRPVRTPTDAS